MLSSISLQSKNIIFSIRNNELTHYMSIFVISLIRDRTKTRAEATLDTSADKSLYGGQLRNHPKLIKSNYRTVPPSDTAIPSTPPPNRYSATVCLETYPLYSFFFLSVCLNMPSCLSLSANVKFAPKFLIPVRCFARRLLFTRN